MSFRSQSLLWLFCIAPGVSCAGARHKPIEPNYAALIAPGTRSPKNEIERAVLAKLGEFKAGTKSVVHGQSVVVDAEYTAASGRACRWITVLDPQRMMAQPDSPPASTELAHGSERELHTLDKGSQPERTGEAALACLVDDGWSFVPDVLRVREPAEDDR